MFKTGVFGIGIQKIGGLQRPGLKVKLCQGGVVAKDLIILLREQNPGAAIGGWAGLPEVFEVLHRTSLAGQQTRIAQDRGGQRAADILGRFVLAVQEIEAAGDLLGIFRIGCQVSQGSLAKAFLPGQARGWVGRGRTQIRVTSLQHPAADQRAAVPVKPGIAAGNGQAVIAAQVTGGAGELLLGGGREIGIADGYRMDVDPRLGPRLAILAQPGSKPNRAQRPDERLNFGIKNIA